MNFLITGGSGFIGSALIRFLIHETKHSVMNIDKLTYAANNHSIANVADNPRYQFIKCDICDQALISEILEEFRPDIIMNLAAESHVDRSIAGPSEFIKTNIVGTSVLLECSRKYWHSLGAVENSSSTDMSTKKTASG